MQFVRVEIEGIERWCFALTKWEATAFVVIGKNRKAPEDEQAVRFGCYDGRPVVWCTDGTHMLSLEPKKGDTPDAIHEVCVTAASLKKCAAKTKVDQLLLVPIDQRLTTHLATKRDLEPGEELGAEGRHLPLDATGPLEWSVSQLYAVDTATEGAGVRTGLGTWETSGRFLSTLAAVAKATGDAAATWVHAPADGAAPLVVRTTDELDGASWRVVIMPR